MNNKNIFTTEITENTERIKKKRIEKEYKERIKKRAVAKKIDRLATLAPAERNVYNPQIYLGDQQSLNIA